MTDALIVTANGGDSDKPAHALDKAGLKARWVLEIDRYERKAKQWTERGKKINNRYTNERKDTEAGTVRYNVLWSNIQTLRPALYGRDPKPEVERRFKDADPVGRTASDVIERCVTYLISKQAFGDTMRLTVLDRLLPGRGVAWCRYVPHFEQGGDDIEGASLTDDAPISEEVTWETVAYDYVHWQDFGHTVARTWQEVDAVWRIAYLDKDELCKRFDKKIVDQIPLDQDPEGVAKEQEGVDSLKKAKIYEIWDKRTNRAIWLHKAVANVLDVKPDPLKLEGFFPCPQPLQATCGTNSFIPTADYTMWADQAAELDRLTQRIGLITKAIKVVGVYDASVPALESMLNGASENKLIAVSTWAAFAEKGGLKGAVELLPVQEIAEILLKLYDARDQVKKDLWEISGLNDLLRGASDPETTATAEKIKAGFSSVRLKDMQKGVQVFARELVRISGEIVCEHFSIDTIKQICGIQLLHDQEKQAIQQQQALMQHMQQMQQPQQPGIPPSQPPQMPPIDPKKLELMDEPSWEDVERLLRDNAARSFRIDIETDSTIAQDEQQEQQARMGFAEAVGKLLESSIKVVNEVPELAPAISETFMFVLRSFKVGRPTEQAFQEAMDKLTEKAAQPQQPKPDPDTIKAQSAEKIAGMKLQADQQAGQQDAQQEAQLEQQRINSEQQLAQFQAQMDEKVAYAVQSAQQQQFEAQARTESQYKAQEAAQHERIEMMHAQYEQQNTQNQQSIQLLIAHLNNANKIEVAEISAQTTLDSAQISAAKQAESNDAAI